MYSVESFFYQWGKENLKSVCPGHLFLNMEFSESSRSCAGAGAAEGGDAQGVAWPGLRGLKSTQALNRIMKSLSA